MGRHFSNHIVVPGRPDIEASTDTPPKNQKEAKEEMAEFIRKIESGELPARNTTEDPVDTAINELFGKMYGRA